MMHLPEPRTRRVVHTAHQLRSEQWDQVDSRELMRRIRCERREGIAWNVTPWTRHQGHRGYLVHSTDGSLYALFFRRKS